jgi:hypothetical protein
VKRVHHSLLYLLSAVQDSKDDDADGAEQARYAFFDHGTLFVTLNSSLGIAHAILAEQ